MNVLCRRRLVMATLPVLMGGCSGSLLPKPQPVAARYTLDAATAAIAATGNRPAAATGARVILVATPTASAGYDTARMLYQRQPQRLEAYAFSEWVEPPAQMLMPLLVRALQTTAAFRAVLVAPSAGKATLRLETGLLWLRQDHTVQPSQLRMAVQAVLLDGTTREVLGSQVFDLSAPATIDDAQGGVVAAQTVAPALSERVALACSNWAAAAPARQ